MRGGWLPLWICFSASLGCPPDLSIKVRLQSYPHSFVLVLPVKDDYRINSKNPLYSQTPLGRFRCQHSVRFRRACPDNTSIPIYITKAAFISRARRLLSKSLLVWVTSAWIKCLISLIHVVTRRTISHNLNRVSNCKVYGWLPA